MAINKHDITEVKSYDYPPQLVKEVLSITCMIVAGDNVSVCYWMPNTLSEIFCNLFCSHSPRFMLIPFPYALFYLSMIRTTTVNYIFTRCFS